MSEWRKEECSRSLMERGMSRNQKEIIGRKMQFSRRGSSQWCMGRKGLRSSARDDGVAVCNLRNPIML